MLVARVIAITIVSLAAALPLEAATLTWDPSTGPGVAGYRVSYGTQPGSYPTQVDVGNALTFTLTPPPGQTYYVVVQAYSEHGSSPRSNELVLSATVTNQPPTLSQPPNQTGFVGSSATLLLTASDPENGMLSFTATGLPAGLSLNSTTRTISGTLQTAGTYNVTATVSDGTLTASRSFSWIVSTQTTANLPPTLNQPSNQTGIVGSAATLALTASDPENATLTLTATGLPAGLSLNSATRTISGTLQTAATYNVIVTVSDGSLTASRTFTWIVQTTTTAPPPPGDTTAPTIAFTSPSNNETLNGKNIRVRITVSDASGVRFVRYYLNGNALSAELTAAPYNYTWDIGSLANGAYQLQARAVDTAGNTGTTTISVTVGGGQGNGKKSLTAEDLEATDESPVSDIPVNGDFDGDGLDDPGAFTASTGEWRLWLSSVRYAPSAPLVWGGENDVPVPADYDGDGRADLAVYRPSSGTWSIVKSNNGNPSRLDVAWGRDEDAPMAFDYDQDGKADLALRRPGGFDILLSSKGYAVSVAVR